MAKELTDDAAMQLLRRLVPKIQNSISKRYLSYLRKRLLKTTMRLCNV